MFCSTCGAQNTGQVRFCRSCGKPLAAAESSQATEDPFQTRLAIPVEQQNLKQQIQQSNNAAPPPDPFATMVAMPAPKVGNTGSPAASSEPQDPFATQVAPAFDPAQLAKELAKKNAAANSGPPPSDDMMKTVVGGFPGPITPHQPQAQDANVDMLKTVVGGMPGLPKPQPAPPGPDPLATVVGMPAINIPKMPPAKPPENKPVAEKQPEKKVESDDKKGAAVATTDSPFAKKSVPQNYDPISTISNAGGSSSSGSNTGIFIVIGVVALVVLIAIAYFVMK